MQLIALLCFVPFALQGQTEISNETQLRAISSNLAGEYILTADINLTSEWIPIGTDLNRFTGQIDGNGKKITGLQYTNSATNGAGFIGVSEGATIKNLEITGARVYGGQDVGILVGRAYAATIIEKCYTSGVASGYDHIGGIVGGSILAADVLKMSKITDCFSTAASVSTSWQAGGIIGTTINIEISNSYFAGTAICSAGSTGGIAALANGGSTSIQNSVVMAPVLKGSAANRVMGNENGNLVSFNNNFSWTGTNVYVNDILNVDGISDAAMKDGEHVDETTLKSASFYKTNLFWSEIIWKIEEGKYPIFPSQTYPLNADAIYFTLFPERALPGATFNTKAVSALNRTITYSSSNPEVATIDNTGLVSFLTNGQTTLTFSTVGDTYSSGSTVTYDLNVQGISYNITTENDLINIKYDLSGEFTLMNNITLTKPWIPIGTFKGKLNGNGKVIYGLTVSDKNNRNKGLFSETEGAEITKLGMEQANVLGNEDVGAIVGNMKGGLVDQCYVTNSFISGRDHIGSLVGAMRSYDIVTIPGDPNAGIPDVTEKRFCTVSNCYAGANVYSREYQAGGIVGIIAGGTVTNCYYSGFVQSLRGRVGGIVSLVDSDDPGEIKNNLNLAVAGYCSEATYRIADWAGRSFESANYPVKFTNNWSKEQSYFGTDLKNSAVKQVLTADDNRDGRNLSNDNNARTQSFYTGTLGWDFTNTWKFIAGTEGKLYPILKWQVAPIVSNVYGIPQPAYLTWYEGSQEAIELKKINATTGQTFTFDVTSGAQFVDYIGDLLYITESSLNDGGITTLALNFDQSLSTILDQKKSSFDIEIIMRDAYTDVSTAQEVVNINNKLFGKFRLTKDIDMSGVNFTGIGSIDTPFTGELNGNGFSIINPVVKTNGEGIKGFFNATNGAKIQKLGIANFSFEGSTTSTGQDIGGLVGACKNTTIEECYLTGNVIGNDHVGGFVGGQADQVSIKNSYVNCIVKGNTQSGGFVGATNGGVTIENCYFAGSVTTNGGWAGGLIGLIDRLGEIKVSNSVSIGEVTSGEKAGAFIGGNIEDNGIPRGTVSLFLNNLYNLDAIITTNGQEWQVATEVPGSVVIAQAKLPSDLKKQATYSAINWDFATVWSIQENVDYPKLKNVKPTKISELKANASKYTLFSQKSNIYIKGIQEEAMVTLYNTNGQMLAKAKVVNNGFITAPATGFYILQIVEKGSNSSVKVICQ